MRADSTLTFSPTIRALTELCSVALCNELGVDSHWAITIILVNIDRDNNVNNSNNNIDDDNRNSDYD